MSVWIVWTSGKKYSIPLGIPKKTSSPLLPATTSTFFRTDWWPTDITTHRNYKVHLPNDIRYTLLWHKTRARFDPFNCPLLSHFPSAFSVASIRTISKTIKNIYSPNNWMIETITVVLNENVSLRFSAIAWHAVWTLGLDNVQLPWNIQIAHACLQSCLLMNRAYLTTMIVNESEPLWCFIALCSACMCLFFLLRLGFSSVFFGLTNCSGTLKGLFLCSMAKPTKTKSRTSRGQDAGIMEVCWETLLEGKQHVQGSVSMLSHHHPHLSV